MRLSDGRLVLAGHARVGGDYDIVLARLTPAGVLDPTFGGGDGKAVLNLAGDDFTGDLALIGGKLYVSGSVGDNLAVVRFAGNGSVDPTFGVGGVAAADFGVVSEGDNGGMAVQSDGKLVVVGRAFGAETSWAVARFLRS